MCLSNYKNNKKSNLDLIVKITNRCNFNCTFCSSTKIGNADISGGEVIDLIQSYDNNIRTIILNGGDPLMVKPEEYQKILDYIDTNSLDTNLSFTTNLWDFYWNPDKWSPIFKHPRVGVITSFQYGEARQIGKGNPFTEKLFRSVSDMFMKHIGYRPDFISVINTDNSEKALEHVFLAKELGVECKLNCASASGRTPICFPIGIMANIYADIYAKNLHPWEYNTKQFIKVLRNEPTTCPILPECDEHIRCFQPSGLYSCGAFGDDDLFSFQLARDIKERQTPLKAQEKLISLKDECLSCPAYKLCNGCKKHILDLKHWDNQSPDEQIIARNCTAMKSAYKLFIKVENSGLKRHPLHRPSTLNG